MKKQETAADVWFVLDAEWRTTLNRLILHIHLKSYKGLKVDPYEFWEGTPERSLNPPVFRV
jgi:hypothetical protein